MGLTLLGQGCGAKSTEKDLDLEKVLTGFILSTSVSSFKAQTAPLAIPGSLKALGFTSHLSPTPQLRRRVVADAASSLALTCATLSSTPVVADGDIEADGSFILSIKDLLGEPMSCSLVDGTGAAQATVMIQDEDNKDLNGEPQYKETLALTDGVDLGEIVYNADTQEVVVPSTLIRAAEKEVAFVSTELFDPSGTWTIAPLDFEPRRGLRTLCPANSQNCHGPKAGESVYFKKFVGLEAASQKSVHALQLWRSQASAQACGDKIGLSSAEQLTRSISFAANTAADGAFNFPTSLEFQDPSTQATLTATVTQGYKLSTATTSHQQRLCTSVEMDIEGRGTQTRVWKCGPNAYGEYMLHAGGGCTRTNSDKPVRMQPQDWSQMGAWSTPELVGERGFRKSTASGTVNGEAVTCVNMQAVLSSTNTVKSTMMNFDHSSLPMVYSGSSNAPVSCASAAVPSGANAATVDLVSKMQNLCYADYYQQNLNEESSACMPRIQANWSASTAAESVRVDFRPRNLLFMDQYVPNAEGDGGSILTRQIDQRGIQMTGGGENQWIPCEIIETGALSLKKIDANKMLVTFTSSQVTTDVNKPACMAEFTGSRETFMFYMTK
jgi:hypothetical protein